MADAGEATAGGVVPFWHVVHLAGEGRGAAVLDALCSVLAHEAEQGIDAAHARPGQWAVKEDGGELPDARAVALGLSLEKGEIIPETPAGARLVALLAIPLWLAPYPFLDYTLRRIVALARDRIPKGLRPLRQERRRPSSENAG